ncbi:PIN domain-containing protein [Asticcacaulis sp. EMRT-3]|uniref:type II toxin-antitoxin system VapC family toxin n=1 Tax=Asticcacaulis sp. EMRT-3 TaxID=3040349 RepID=UPI0024AF0A76|nr:PIN domain-containing protein [Asticcacaulis sp. EMRT-3]MDI7774926.1 PIN domain-containing protein [Asticcacaulis sp. EMRT-3]
MILADTSVWVEYLRQGEPRLAHWLERSQVLCHPFVVGELALGGLKPDSPVLHLLKNLPQAICAADDEVLGFIARHDLSGRGIGWVDAHLLAAAALTPDARLWTFDRRLHTAAVHVGVAAGI